MRKKIRVSSVFEKSLSMGIFLLAVLIFTFFSALYIQKWYVGYSSDTALIGLMAKHISEYREFPLFVWSVGYQGILLEAYLGALLFKFFGVSPFVLNFSPFIYLIIALAIWIYLLWREFSLLTAATVFLLSVSSFPMFYKLYERTLPNFSEALLLGAVSFLAFFYIVRHYEVYKKLALKSFVGLAVCVGFGFYLFAITGYFFISLGICSVLIMLRPIQGGIYRNFFAATIRSRREKNSSHKFSIPRRLKIVARFCYFGLSLILFCGGFWGLFFFPATFVFNDRVIKSNPMIMCIGGGLLLLLPGIIKIVSIISAKVERRYYLSALFLGGVIFGHSPALIHKIFLDGTSKKPMGISGNWNTLVERFGYLMDFHRQLFSLSTYGWSWVIAACYVGALLWFFYMTWKKTKRYLKGSREVFPKEFPFAVMIIFMVGIFLCARMVVDEFSVRYLIYLAFIYHIVFGYCWSRLWQESPRLRILWLGILVGSVLIGSLHIYKSLEEPYNPIYKNIQTLMDEHKLKYGYSDYWYAYATTFLANEAVILEPIYSNYNPDYGKIVGREKVVAYIEVVNHPKAPPIENGHIIEIAHQRYKITKMIMLKAGLRFNILESMDIGE